jgi:hypothetical protein
VQVEIRRILSIVLYLVVGSISSASTNTGNLLMSRTIALTICSGTVMKVVNYFSLCELLNIFIKYLYEVDGRCSISDITFADFATTSEPG